MGGQPSSAQRFLAVWQNPAEAFARLAMIVLVILLAVLVYVVIRRVLGRLRRQLAARSQAAPEALRRRISRSLTLTVLLSSIAKWVIILLAAMWILTLAGMNLLPILTGAGILGVALSLGAQGVVKDFISGFFIILEGQFAVGDHVTINTVFGIVEEVGLRVTVLRDPAGRVHYLPNGTITTVTVFEEPKVDYTLEFELADPAQAKPATAVLKALLEEAKGEFGAALRGFAEPEIRKLGGDLTAVRANLELFPQQEWLAIEELPARLARRLKAAGIELAEGAAPRAYTVGIGAAGEGKRVS